jgi:hypothetical protein
MTSDWLNGVFILCVVASAILYAFGAWGVWELVKFIVRTYQL